MKKIIAVFLAAMLMMAAAAAEPAGLPEQIQGMTFTFTSGVGGWSTELLIGKDGAFTGSYHDSEMGDADEAYPNGTVYFCSFSGRMSLLGQADEQSWRVVIEKLEKEPAEETVEDGIRYVPAEIYGLTEGDEMLLYSPGTPVGVFSEDMLLWAHVADQENPPSELEDWFLMSEKNDSGFVGYAPAGLANPWENLTAEELRDASGLAFGVPEDAENVVLRYLQSEGLAEMQFTLENDEYCARILPAAQEEGQLTDISGMYYTWDHEEDVMIGQCAGVIRLAQNSDGSWEELCLWYDAEQGLQYSLSVHTADPDGLDLTALAEQVSMR